MDPLLERIYAEGIAHDASATDKRDMRLNITPETGRFLELLIGESRPRRIIELGTSNGYSTLWITRAAGSIGAAVETIDILPQKTEAAKKNLTEAALLDFITFHTMSCTDFLDACPDHHADFVFLDSDRSQYAEWWPNILRVLNFGTLVVDNALSHVEEIAAFRQLVAGASGLDSIVLPIGKGQLVVRPH